MEQLIQLIIFAVGAAVFYWFKRRNESRESDSSPTRNEPPPSAQPPSSAIPKRMSWEEEMRRLLQGMEPPRNVPPPVVERRTPPPVMAPAPQPIFAPAPKPVVVTKPVVVPPSSLLSVADNAYQRSTLLDEKVEQHLRAITALTSAARRRRVKPPREVEPTLALSWLRNRRTLRSAIIASALLGPPKALERVP